MGNVNRLPEDSAHDAEFSPTSVVHALETAPRAASALDPRRLPIVGPRVARLDLGGVLVGAFFFCLSLTPSLLPRTWLFQALVSGITMTMGYAIGAGLWAVARRLNTYVWPRWSPSVLTVARAWAVVTSSAVAGSLWFLISSVRWQLEVRTLMEVDEPGSHYAPAMIAVAVLVAVGFLMLG